MTHRDVAPAATRSGGASRVLRGGNLTVDNRSGYDTRDLHRFFLKGLRAMKVTGPTHVVVAASPIRSRGCAQVGGRVIVISIASPANFSMRRLSRLFEHEVAHKVGSEHHHMSENLLYSLGPTSEWAKGMTIRYRGRAPTQL